MSSITIREVEDRSERRRWVHFVYDHYRGHPHWVPPLLSDELAYFDPSRNPAFDAARVRMFLALDGDEPVGRVCAIVHEAEADKVGRPVGRFGWFESIDDPAVAHGLLDRAADWLRSEGCVEVRGPLGFSDLDPTGILIEGHDLTATVAGSYHHPYYAGLIAEYGFEKEIDYLEFRMDVTEPVPFLERIRSRVEEVDDRYTLVTPGSRREMLAQADAFWRVMQETYRHLFGVVPLTEAQTKFYTRKYLTYLDPEFVEFAYDRDGELVGLLVGMPNLSRALQRAGGRLLPFGFWHILREYRRPETVELLLAALHPDESSNLLTARGLIRMYDTLRRRGVRYLDTNRQLETNTVVNRIWRRFQIIGRRRVRVYRMALE